MNRVEKQAHHPTAGWRMGMGGGLIVAGLLLITASTVLSPAPFSPGPLPPAALSPTAALATAVSPLKIGSETLGLPRPALPAARQVGQVSQRLIRPLLALSEAPAGQRWASAPLAPAGLWVAAAPAKTPPLLQKDAAVQPPAAKPVDTSEPEGNGKGVRRPVAAITLSNVIDEGDLGQVQNVALRLQNEAETTNTEALLVIEVQPGTSRFGMVRDLTQFLTSARISRVRTVAWIPETVDGTNAIVPLACKEIVMHPDVELGDLGRGQALPPEDAQFVRSIVEKRHNLKLSPALAEGMLNPQAVVLKATIGTPPRATVRIVSAEELKRLRDTTEDAIDVETVKEAGMLGRFSGAKGRAQDLLVTGTAQSRQDLAALYDLPPSALRQDAPSGAAPKVAFIKIDGVIEPMLRQFVERQIDRAIGSGATLIIFEIDSPGGLLLTSQELAFYISDLSQRKVRTVAYVPRQALSGAAMISLGCDEIYLQPEAIIGDAEPIETRDGQQFEQAPEKVLSVLRELLRQLAARKGRPEAVAEAMADQNLAVYEVTNAKTGRVWFMTEAEIHQGGDEWIKGPALPETREGNLLTVNGHRAHLLKIAEPAVDDLEELKQRLGIPANVTLRPVGRTWIDTLVFTLNRPMIAALLIALGVVLIYVELHLMTGLLGILSVLCFALFFWSKFLGGTAGWLEVVLFLLGLGCLALEIFVIPGFGVFGVTGGLLIIAALVMASQTFGNLGVGTDFDQMTGTVGTLAGSLVVTIGSAMIISRFLPHIPFLGSMILVPPGTADVGPRLREVDEAASPARYLGKRGVTLSSLRPAGKAEVEGDYLDVFSEGPYVDPGVSIEVVRQDGHRLIVREIRHG